MTARPTRSVLAAQPATFSTYHLDMAVTEGETLDHAWWSGSLADADSQVTEPLDLGAVAAGDSPTLRFSTWYRLEDGYDWAYVLVSTDGGGSWTSLETTSEDGSGTTKDDPLALVANVPGGNKKYEDGFTGDSGFAPTFTGQNGEPARSEQQADLTRFAGKEILLRFAYTSDAGTNLENFYVDDIAVVNGAGAPLDVGAANPDDAESSGNWTPGGEPGFARVADREAQGS